MIFLIAFGVAAFFIIIHAIRLTHVEKKRKAIVNNSRRDDETKTWPGPETWN